MVIKVKEKELQLNNSEVKSAKHVVAGFIDKVKSISKDGLSPTYYFTFLIVMHTLSQELINEIDAETLEIIMNRLKKQSRT